MITLKAYLSLIAQVLVLLCSGAAIAGPADEGASVVEGAACRYSIAYSAPEACPSAAELENRLGPNFRVERVAVANCADCVRGITITDRSSSAAMYRLELAGLEATAVQRSVCRELVELGVYAIEASDLPAPRCNEATARVGAAAVPLVDLRNREPLVLFEARVSLLLGAWQVVPFGLWMAPMTVPNRVAGTPADSLSLTGYGAGLDACRVLTSHTQVCASGMWRSLSGRLDAPGFEWGSAGSLWTVGAALAWEYPVGEHLRVEVAPALAVALTPAHVTEETAPEPLYVSGGLEALLRVGFSWEFGAGHTPINTERWRNVARKTNPRRPTKLAKQAGI